jgi:hypothetical protein
VQNWIRRAVDGSHAAGGHQFLDQQAGERRPHPQHVPHRPVVPRPVSQDSRPIACACSAGPSHRGSFRGNATTPPRHPDRACEPDMHALVMPGCRRSGPHDLQRGAATLPWRVARASRRCRRCSGNSTITDLAGNSWGNTRRVEDQDRDRDGAELSGVGRLVSRHAGLCLEHQTAGTVRGALRRSERSCTVTPVGRPGRHALPGL